MQRNEIQIGYLSNDYFVLVTKDRDLVFKCALDYNDIESDIRIPFTDISNPDLEMLRFILTSRDCVLRDGLLDLYRGIIMQLPESCGVFDTDRSKYRTLCRAHTMDIHYRQEEIDKCINSLWKNYESKSDDELLNLMYDSLYKIAQNIPQSCFTHNEPEIVPPVL